MKKYVLFIVLFLSLFSFNANAILPIGFYGGAKISKGLGKHYNNKDGFIRLRNPSASASVVTGIKLLDFRFELEYAYKMNAGIIELGNHNKKFDIDLKMLNVYYDFFDYSIFKLYANTGFGSYNAKTTLIEQNSKKVWNIGVGANVSLLDMLNVDIGIRHVELGKMKFHNQSTRSSFEEIYGGARFGF